MDAKCQRICLAYDPLNRLEGKYYPPSGACPVSPAYNVSYIYDERQYGIGKRTSMSDPTGETAWDFDARGRVITETRVITGSLGTFVTAWSYNSADLLTSMRYPADNLGNLGELVQYNYHPQLSLDSMVGSFPQPYVLGTEYDAAGRVVERTLGQYSLQTDYTYYPWTSQGGRLQQILSGTPSDPDSLQDLRYTFDQVGNVLTIQDYRMGNPQWQNFDYDNLYRLESASATGGYGGIGNYGPEGYTYSPATGNLASKGGASYTYGDANHAHAVTAVPSKGWSFVYDNNGNMTQRNLNGQVYNLGYDRENRMTSVSGAASAAYGYDGDGTRIMATEGVTTTVYIGK